MNDLWWMFPVFVVFGGAMMSKGHYITAGFIFGMSIAILENAIKLGA